MTKEKSTTSHDDYAGQGGSYLIDKDGKKTLVHRTEPAGAETAPQAKEKARK